ncbi:hypothetical protein GCM10029992_29690 [Glycomyces albus]
MSALLVLVMYVADHPRLARRAEQRLVVLDTVHRGEEALRADLEARLGMPVLRAVVLDTDYVRETMTVEVRYRPVASGSTAREETTVPLRSAR